MKRKIIFTLVVVCFMFTAIVVPSFAWSTSVTNQKVNINSDKFESYGYEDGTFYFYIDGSITAGLPLSSSNQWRDTLVRFEVYTSHGSVATVTLSPNGSTPRSWLYSVDGYFYNGSYELYSNIDLLVTLTSYSTMIFEIANFETIPFYNELHARVTFSPDTDYIRDNVIPDVYQYFDDQSEVISSLESEVDYLNDVIENQSNTINGLKNNNVLDGVFSGIGSGFSAFVTPLLSLGVGGVTLGNVIAVLLIIGAILVFVLLINKIRGA